MKLAANLTLLFNDAPLLARPALAAAAGFDGVEVLFPYEAPVTAWPEALAGLPVALINTPCGDRAAGERGFAAVPGAENRFRDDFTQALIYARGMGTKRVHVMAGNTSGGAAVATFRANLEWAAMVAGDLCLTIEPLNPKDMPGYFLNCFDQAVQIISDLQLPNLGLQFDLWHATQISGDADAVWGRVADWVSHVQIAGLSSRSEPCALAKNFARHIVAAGYQGWIAAEYMPSPGAPMGWVADLRQ